jgi:hypothetical protein
VFVVGKSVRISVITDTCVRLEYSRRGGEFEDRPSVVVARRSVAPPSSAQPLVRVSRASQSGPVGRGIEVETRRLRLRFVPAPPDCGLLPPSALSIDLLPSCHRLWPTTAAAAGTGVECDNLLGVARVLRAEVEQDQGVVSRAGFTLLDDSTSPVLAEPSLSSAATGRPVLDAVPRTRDPADLDLYFLGYGTEYSLALRDLATLTGDVPLPPRWAFGIWWHVPGVEAAEAAAAEFRRYCGVPVSGVIVGPTDEPRSTATAEKLRKAVRSAAPWVCLTTLAGRAVLRPGDIGYQEVAREAFAGQVLHEGEEMPPIRVDLANARLAAAYRRHVAGRLLAMGCGGWWLEPDGHEDVPLLLLDVHRPKEEGVVVFAPYSGLGSHRSATVIRTAPLLTRWEVLRSLPEFTCCAGNACCFYWSPDVGGTLEGTGDSELFVRWVQFASVSPIFRIRAPGKPEATIYEERRPWMYDDEVLRIVQQSLQFRISLVPYLYSAAFLSREQSVPLVRPMYFAYPSERHAFHCPHQFLLGSDLMVAPFLLQADPFTRLSRQTVWFPPGLWFDVFDGTQYRGNQWQAFYGALDEMPLFARAGAIIPFMLPNTPSDTLSSDVLDIVVFPGGGGGSSVFRLADDGAITCTITLHGGFDGKITVLTIDQASAAPKRIYTVIFRCITRPITHAVEADGTTVTELSRMEYDEESYTATIGPIGSIAGSTVISVRIEGVTAVDAQESWQRRTDAVVEKMLVRFNADSSLRQKLEAELHAQLEILRRGIHTGGDVVRALYTAISEGTAQELPSKSQIRALTEVLCSCGCIAFDSGLANERRRHVVAWNNEGLPEMTMIRPASLRAIGSSSNSSQVTRTAS